VEAVTAPAAEAQAEPRALLTLLPAGRDRVVVGVAALALAVGSVVDFGASGRALVGVVLCPVLVLLAAIDLGHRVLPNAIIFPAVLGIGLIVAAADPAGFLEHLYAALALFGFLFLFAALVPSGLGMGDAKLGFLLGLALGSRTLSAMLATFAASFLAALWILARQGLSARKQTIPFGPYMALGGILAFFLG
jgi:prepilin signal peptidase PulO-like enzyme (type II secretory pathway)